MQFPRVSRIVMLTIIIVIVGFLVYFFRGALFPFFVGGILAYIVYPIVRRLEQVMPWRKRRPALARIMSIVIVTIALAGAVAGALIAIVPPLVDQAGQFVVSLPQFLMNAQNSLEALNAELSAQIPEEFRQEVQNALQNAGTTLVSAGQGILARTFQAASQAITIVIGLASVPLILYYMLMDRDTIKEGLLAPFPDSLRSHVRNILTILNNVVGSYVKGQLFLGLVVGVMAFIGLFILDIQFAAWLGLAAGIFELVPILGPWLGAIPGVIVTLATAPEKTIWVILVYVGIQLVENSLLVPRVQGHILKLHPLLIILALLVGSEIAGFWGVLLGPPIAAAAKEVFSYISRAMASPQTSTPMTLEPQESFTEERPIPTSREKASAPPR